jgi:serine/threonine protein kinase
MPPITIDKLCNLVLSLRLIESAQLDECRSRLGPENNQAADLLWIMESKHYLTPYQVSRLEKGQPDGLVLGNCKLLYKNGSGSFARVYRACSLENGKMVGLKVLRERLATDSQTVYQFHREAELCKKLSHKNIVPIFDVARHADYHYFTMEFIEGGNLRDFINIRKKLSPTEATRAVLDMCEGLEYALSKGITHRDLKMTNALMSSRGVVKLVDFGLAGHAGFATKTTIQSLHRALEYATLEKGTNSSSNDPRTDLFFLGAIYYELLTGTPPYPRTRNRSERRLLTRYTNVRPLRSLDPNIPNVVLEIVERLMKVSPDQRYQNATDVVLELQAALSEIGESTNVPKPSEREEPSDNGASSNQRSLPTVMCIENRIKQQNILRNYLSKRGFRVLVLSDLQRGMKRLRTNPPDCVVLMGESIGDDVMKAYSEAVKFGESHSVVSIAVLTQSQSVRKEELEQTGTARVMVQPVQLRDLCREIHLAFQRRLRDVK